jgi:hypothetical protein
MHARKPLKKKIPSSFTVKDPHTGKTIRLYRRANGTITTNTRKEQIGLVIRKGKYVLMPYGIELRGPKPRESYSFTGPDYTGHGIKNRRKNSGKSPKPKKQSTKPTLTRVRPT